MGEYAEMMLDGTCCSSCGEFLDIDGLASGDFEPQGFPGLCATCAREERRGPRLPRFSRYAVKGNPKVQQPGDPLRQGGKMSCPFCVRKVKVAGFGDHMLTQHRDKWPSDSGRLPEGEDPKGLSAPASQSGAGGNRPHSTGENP